MSWINHSPPACWSTFWKSTFKQKLGCMFDMMDRISSLLVFWHMQLYMSWTSFHFSALSSLLKECFYFIFIKYSCTNTFHKSSPYNLYNDNMSILLQWRHSTVCHSMNSRNQSADTYRIQFLSIGVLNWSLCARNMFALIIAREHQMDDIRNPNARSFQLHQNLSTHPIQVSHLHG